MIVLIDTVQGGKIDKDFKCTLLPSASFCQCSLACHKKCLETLAIQCGHKKLQGRLQLFGIDFAQAAKNSPDGIPFIIKKCTSEIESRALNIKVRVLFKVQRVQLKVLVEFAVTV